MCNRTRRNWGAIVEVWLQGGTDLDGLKVHVFDIGSVDQSVCSEKVAEESIPFGDYDTDGLLNFITKISFFLITQVRFNILFEFLTCYLK